jgi:hypothetical protein
VANVYLTEIDRAAAVYVAGILAANRAVIVNDAQQAGGPMLDNVVKAIENAEPHGGFFALADPVINSTLDNLDAGEKTAIPKQVGDVMDFLIARLNAVGVSQSAPAGAVPARGIRAGVETIFPASTAGPASQQPGESNAAFAARTAQPVTQGSGVAQRPGEGDAAFAARTAAAARPINQNPGETDAAFAARRATNTSAQRPGESDAEYAARLRNG